tara:strand:+ start:199 stop:624 length:426 start_codon:yes stop_codon:yes gene_type:complete
MKLTWEQRQKIKEQIREESLENEEEERTHLSRRDIKKMFAEELNDDLESNKEIKKHNRAKKRAFKRQEREKDKVEITWNIGVGDAVHFNRGGEEYYGMVIEQNADGKYRNAREAKYRGWVLVMSSAGKHWMNPSDLTVIED